MKIKPVILCGGAGTRLWPDSKKNLAKQFIDFGGWTLFEKVLERIKNPIFDYPIISTNLSYLKLVQEHLKKNKINKYQIILEPYKKNTAAAILSSALHESIPYEQPMVFFPADHLIEKTKQFNNSIDAAKFIIDKGITLVLLEQTNKSKSIYEIDWSFPICFIVGNEVKGVSEELSSLAHIHAEIPMRGVKQSLNVSVATGIAGYEFSKVYSSLRK